MLKKLLVPRVDCLPRCPSCGRLLRPDGRCKDGHRAPPDVAIGRLDAAVVGFTGVGKSLFIWALLRYLVSQESPYSFRPFQASEAALGAMARGEAVGETQPGYLEPYTYLLGGEAVQQLTGGRRSAAVGLHDFAGEHFYSLGNGGLYRDHDHALDETRRRRLFESAAVLLVVLDAGTFNDQRAAAGTPSASDAAWAEIHHLSSLFLTRATRGLPLASRRVGVVLTHADQVSEPWDTLLGALQAGGALGQVPRDGIRHIFPRWPEHFSGVREAALFYVNSAAADPSQGGLPDVARWLVPRTWDSTRRSWAHLALACAGLGLASLALGSPFGVVAATLGGGVAGLVAYRHPPDPEGEG